MATREELVQMAKDKYRADLVQEAKAKYARESGESESVPWEAVRVGAERGATMGTRPTVAGLGAGLGAASSTLFDQGGGLGDAWDAGKEAFSEAREGEIQNQAALEKAHPTATMVGNIGGSLLTAPLTPVKGIMGAAKIGGLTGLGEAIGTSETAEDAAAKVGGGAVMGAGSAAALKGVGKGLSYIGDKVKNSALGQAAGEFLDKASRKVGSAVTGLPEEDVGTYMTKTDEVNKVIGDFGDDIPSAVDKARENINRGIQNQKNKINKEITDALEKGAENYKVYSTGVAKGGAQAGDAFGDVVEKTDKIAVKGILEELERVKGQFHDKTQKAVRSQVDEMIRLVKEVAPSGEASLKDVFALQKALGEQSKKAFLKNGQVFINDAGVSRAAKAGYTAARKMVNQVSPEIAAANKKLHLMHHLEERMNRNLLAEGKTPASYLAGGSGSNKVVEKQLRKMGELTGAPVLEEARLISSADKFAKPGIVPFGTTGLTATRLATGAGLGGAVAALNDENVSTGAAIGAGLSSPLALKTLINSKNAMGKLAQSAGGQASKALATGVPQSVLTQNIARVGGKYAQILKDAEARGPQAVAATSYILQQRDPELRQKLREQED
jgi:hypothetical protein